MQNRVTTIELAKLKKEGRKISALTAYDAPFARLIDGAGADIILVGDSLGMTVLGRENTLSVTLDEIEHHTRAVAAAVSRAMVVADMPFMSFQVSPQKALENAGRLIKKTGAQAVKLEGGMRMKETIKTIVDAGIPLMGHVGLTPQSLHQLGGYKVQGKRPDAARRVMEDAKASEEAGVFAVVLEAIPMDLAKDITAELGVPTIGIGAGPHCDGQILVMHDVLGLTEGMKPRFVKVYTDLAAQAEKAFKEYIDEVRSGQFPTKEHSYVRTKLKVVAKGSRGK
ncbi:MAG: 3-methyl-2-oxobutanoate hydroxymethyltransferase [Nitrospinota bacterium]